MADVFSDRRFVTYLVLSNLALVALAIAGPIWFVAGLVAFVAIEIASAVRDEHVRTEIAAVLAERR